MPTERDTYIKGNAERASADADSKKPPAHEQSERNLERSIKKGLRAPKIKVVTRLLLAVLLLSSLAAFGTGLMRYTELQREKEVLEDKVEKYEAEVEKLEYLIDSPVDYDYIVRVAKEKLGLYLPDEIIYYNDSNK